jgi:hypothetical protein
MAIKSRFRHLIFLRQFAENELWPIAGQIDKSCAYPEQQILKMGELGKYNLCKSILYILLLLGTY